MPTLWKLLVALRDPLLTLQEPALTLRDATPASGASSPPAEASVMVRSTTHADPAAMAL